MFSFIKQKKMLDDLSNIKKKQLVKQSQTIIENKNKIQQIHQLDLTEAPKGSKAATKKKNSKSSSSSSAAAATTSLNSATTIEKSNSSSLDNNLIATENDLNINLQNQLIKLAEAMQEKDSELAEFYMRRFHLESACSDSVSRHSSNYVKSCQFCGHSFLDRNTGYQLAKQNSTKIVIKDVTKGDKLCSLNLKQFFTTKNEKMKWSHIVYCLCSQKDANNNVLTFKCKQCQKYLIIPFDKTIASQIVPTTQKTEQKSETQNQREESKHPKQPPHSKQEEKSTIPSNNPHEKKNKKQSNSGSELNQSTDSQKKEKSQAAPKEDDKKRKRDDSNSLNNNASKNNSSKKKKNKKETTSASDFLKLL